MVSDYTCYQSFEVIQFFLFIERMIGKWSHFTSKSPWNLSFLSTELPIQLATCEILASAVPSGCWWISQSHIFYSFIIEVSIFFNKSLYTQHCLIVCSNNSHLLLQILYSLKFSKTAPEKERVEYFLLSILSFQVSCVNHVICALFSPTNRTLSRHEPECFQAEARTIPSITSSRQQSKHFSGELIT